MPDIKETLIALFKSYKCEFENCDKCPHPKIPGACSDYVWNGLADHLIANGVTVQGWISVKDRLPDMNEEVFAVYKNSLFENGPKFTKVLHRESKYWVDRNGYRYLYENITHWMPLPQPPKGE